MMVTDDKMENTARTVLKGCGERVKEKDMKKSLWERNARMGWE